MELLNALTLGPARARVARILRDDLPQVLRFTRAAVFLPGPSGRPRLLASTGDGRSLDGDGPNRLRTAVVAATLERKAGGETPDLPRTVAFSADEHEGDGEALVCPLSIGGALVVYRAGGRWTGAEVKHAVATARFVSRALAWSAIFT